MAKRKSAKKAAKKKKLAPKKKGMGGINYLPGGTVTFDVGK